MTNASIANHGERSAFSDAGRDALEEASEYLVRKVRDLAHSADDYVHDNPWTAVGLVALIGLTAGYYLSRRT